MKQIILETNTRYPFKWITKQYGKAQFDCCTQWNQSKLVKLWLYPRQQPDNDNIYVANVNEHSDSLSITSWSHENIEIPNIWRHNWCEEHKCLKFSFYVPSETTHFTVMFLSTFSIHFERNIK